MVPLTSEDLADLERLRTTAEERDVLNALIPASVEVTSTSTEAQLVHAVIVVGLRAVHQGLADQSDATQAATQGGDKERRSITRQPRPCWTEVR